MACPLLQGLSPEEQRARMKDDPRIAACIGALSGECVPDAKSAKLLRAYEARIANAEAAQKAARGHSTSL